MNNGFTNAFVLPESNLKLAKKCLALIRDIAAQGACSDNPEHIGYALHRNRVGGPVFRTVPWRFGWSALRRAVWR